MRAVVQRVRRASARVDTSVVGTIELGLLVFLGVGRDDTVSDVLYIADKLCNLRLFADVNGKMNLSVREANGAVLIVSQFTLFGDCRRGRRPSYISAARPDAARVFYQAVVSHVRKAGINVQTGQFQATMDIDSVNDGPVTVMLDSSRAF